MRISDLLDTFCPQIFGVVDYSGEPVAIEAGVGFGITRASDHLTLKLMFSRDLN
jgi:hypothetical protein